MMKNNERCCWYCKTPLRQHNMAYCEHIWNWKHGYCKAVGPVIYPKFHTKPIDTTNTPWGMSLHFE